MQPALMLLRLNGRTTPPIHRFHITQQGTYWVEGRITNGTTTDTINVKFYHPLLTVNLSNDTLCKGVDFEWILAGRNHIQC